MSRTYRKVHHNRDQVLAYENGEHIWRDPTKAEWAKIRSDGGPWRHNTKWWMNQVSRKCRRVNKKQINKLHNTHQDDIMYFDFDDSEYTKKRKGIWWEIY